MAGLIPKAVEHAICTQGDENQPDAVLRQLGCALGTVGGAGEQGQLLIGHFQDIHQRQGSSFGVAEGCRPGNEGKAPLGPAHLMQKRALIAMQYSALHNRTWKTPTVQKPCSYGLQNKKTMKSFDFTAFSGAVKQSKSEPFSFDAAWAASSNVMVCVPSL